MKKRKKVIVNKKLRGEWTEMCFMVRATEHGLPVSKPWGEMQSYDFVVGWPGHFVAVQVKSTICELGAGYGCTLRGSQNRRYPRGSFDFVAAYVILEDCWYIIPEEAVEGMERISLASDSERAHYEKYREAWHLLERPKEDNWVGDIKAFAEFAPAEFDSVDSTEGVVSIFAHELRSFAQSFIALSS